MSDRYRNQQVAYLALVAVFVISDVTDVMAFDFSVWVGIDYFVRCGVLLLIAGLVARRVFPVDDIGFAGVRKDILLVHGVLLAAASLVFVLFVMLPLKGVFSPGLGALPVPASPFWPGVDRYLGLPLLVVSEEVVFRGIALTVLRKAGLGTVGVVLISAGLFALSYWTHSLRAIVAMGVLGIFFMVSTLRTKNVIPAMVGHYLVLWFWRQFREGEGKIRQGRPGETPYPFLRIRMLSGKGYAVPLNDVGGRPPLSRRHPGLQQVHHRSRRRGVLGVRGEAEGGGGRVWEVRRRPGGNAAQLGAGCRAGEGMGKKHRKRDGRR